jgi:hypothetical protein
MVGHDKKSADRDGDSGRNGKTSISQVFHGILQSRGCGTVIIHCALIPAARITLPHLSVSERIT